MSSCAQSRSRWPFWLLLAAWLCANCPPRAAYVVVSWLEEARSFSHQRQLSFEVAHLLGGETLPERFAASDDAVPTPPKPAVPLNEEVKKISLALEVERTTPGPIETDSDWQRVMFGMRDRLDAAPPHGPPRRDEIRS